MSDLVNRFDQLSVTLTTNTEATHRNPDPGGTSCKKRRRKKHKKPQQAASDSVKECPPSPDSHSYVDTEPGESNADPSRLRPRGFQNYKNRCYLNVTLQALLHCPPMIQLFRHKKTVSPDSDGLISDNGPLSKLMFELFSQFVPLTMSSPLGPSTVSNSDRTRRGIIPYELGPSLCVSSEFITALNLEDGFQQDGAECLNHLVSKLHEEFGSGRALYDTSAPNEVDGDFSGDWIVTGRRGKRVPVARKTELQGGSSPIGDLFSGSITTRSLVNWNGSATNGHCPSTTEPFFLLPLEIADPKITSIDSALLKLGDSEFISDYQNDVTNTPSSIRRRLSIDRLPPYLMLQLKRFSFVHPESDKTALAIEKNVKEIAVPMHLTIPAKILSAEKTFTMSQRRYILYAVIFHLGQSANSGHYTVAVRWPSASDASADQCAFLYLDDARACLLQSLNSIRLLLSSNRPLDPVRCQFSVLSSSSTSNLNHPILHQPRTPYILIYEANESTPSSLMDRM